MLLRTETYTNEHNVKMKKMYYGFCEDEKEVITSIVETPDAVEREDEFVPTQLDIIVENQLIIMEALAAQYEENLA